MVEYSFTYRAFISYSHADHDHAVWIHKALERYRVPRHLSGAENLRRIGKVFRDEEELGAAAELGPKIEAALKSSDVLIVVCSPRAAQSKWVNQEIETFKRLGRAHRVFALITDGQPHGASDAEGNAIDCFPDALKHNPDGTETEPLAVDIRKFGKDDAALRLLAGLLDVGYDDLRQRELHRRRAEMIRAQALFVAGLVLVAAALTGGWFAAANYVDASEKRSEIFAREAESLSRAGDGSKAILMALYGDPAAEATWVERIFRPDGYAHLRRSLASSYTHERIDFVLQRKGENVLAVAYSPKGDRVATASDKTGGHIWSADGEIIATFGKGDYINGLQYSPNGDLLASIDSEGRVKIWLAGSTTGDIPKLLAIYAGHTAPGAAVAFSPDGKFLASAAQDGKILLRPVDGGQPVSTINASAAAIASISFAPDSGSIVSSAYDSTVKLWKLERRPENIVSAHLAGVYPVGMSLSVAISPDGKIIAAADNVGATLWEVLDDPAARPKRIASLQGNRGHSGYVYAVAFSPDGRWVATGSNDGTAMLWPSSNPLSSPLITLNGHSQIVNSLAFSPDGKTLLTGSGDGTARLNPIFDSRETTRYGSADESDHVVFSPDGKLVAVSSRHAELWPVSGGTKIADFILDDGYLEALAFSPDGKAVFTASSEGNIDIWPADGREGGRPRPLRSFKVAGETLTFSPDGAMALTADIDGNAFVRSMADGAVRDTFRLGNEPVKAAAFSPDSSMILLGSNSGEAALWILGDPKPRARFDGRKDWGITSVAFASDGKRVLTSDWGNVVRIWPLDGGYPLWTISNASSSHGAGFSPNGTMIVTTDLDEAKVWAAAEGTALATFDSVFNMGSAVFSPDGKSVLTGHSHGPATLQSLDSILFAKKHEQIEMSCAKLVRTRVKSFVDEDYQRFPILDRKAPHPCAKVWAGK